MACTVQSGFQVAMKLFYGLPKAMITSSILIRYEFQQNIRASDISKARKRGNRQENPLGKNPSDIWDVVTQDWEDGVWDIPNVKANHPEKTEHPCQFPVELVQRCVLALTDADGIVLDPYCGVGSTIIAALQHNRKSDCC